MGLSLTANSVDLINQIKYIRLHSRLTLCDVQVKADVDAGNLSRMENLKQGVTLDTFCRIAAALGYRVTLTKEDGNEN